MPFQAWPTYSSAPTHDPSHFSLPVFLAVSEATLKVAALEGSSILSLWVPSYLRSHSSHIPLFHVEPWHERKINLCCVKSLRTQVFGSISQCDFSCKKSMHNGPSSILLKVSVLGCFLPLGLSSYFPFQNTRSPSD